MLRVMASVSVNQRSKGKGLPWRVQWRDHTGKPHQKTFDLKREADAYATKLEAELLSATYIDPRKRRIPFADQHAAWLLERRVSPSRQAAEKSLSTNHVLPRWGRTPIEDITHADVQRWVNQLREKYAWETVAACRQIVRHVLAHALRAKKLTHNAAEHINVPDKPRRDITSTDVLTPDEVARLVDAAPPEWAAYLLGAAWLGWRLNEGTEIRVGDLNLPLRQLTLRGTKTRTSTRVIPLPPTVATAIEKHLITFVRDHRPGALVFPTAAGTVADRSNMRRMLQRALKDAGLEGRGIDYRQLRHTAASLMFAAGVSPMQVSYILGHSRPSTTTDVYTHLLPRVFDNGVLSLEAFMNGVHE